MLGALRAPLRSFEAQLLPHLVSVVAGASGRVTAVHVRTGMPVIAGEALVELEVDRWLAGREQCGERLVVVAPVSGTVYRCHVSRRDIVHAARPLLLLAETQDYWVAAFFEGPAPRIRPVRCRAWVYVKDTGFSAPAEIVHWSTGADARPGQEAVAARALLRLERFDLSHWPVSPLLVEIVPE